MKKSYIRRTVDARAQRAQERAAMGMDETLQDLGKRLAWVREHLSSAVIANRHALNYGDVDGVFEGLSAALADLNAARQIVMRLHDRVIDKGPHNPTTKGNVK